MSEIVERVARAIAKHRLGGAPEEEYWTDPVSGASFFRREARAAIEAMREPSEAMLVAGGEKHSGNDYFNTRKDFEDEASAIYRAMIDEALK